MGAVGVARGGRGAEQLKGAIAQPRIAQAEPAPATETGLPPIQSAAIESKLSAGETEAAAEEDGLADDDDEENEDEDDVGGAGAEEKPQ